ncbi:hypothetical protein FCH38_00140 [Agrobacterium tumefaciens]|nr:hypothetical protein [Agrobacterium tumefaciens]
MLSAYVPPFVMERRSAQDFYHPRMRPERPEPRMNGPFSAVSGLFSINAHHRETETPFTR